MFFPGVGWADGNHDVAVLDEAAHLVGSRRVLHSAARMMQLKEFLLGVGGVPLRMLHLVETTYGLLTTALLQTGLAVYPMNPKVLDRPWTPAPAKTHAIDAYPCLLARTGRNDLADPFRAGRSPPLLCFRRQRLVPGVDLPRSLPDRGLSEGPQVICVCQTLQQCPAPVRLAVHLVGGMIGRLLRAKTR